MAKRKFRIDTGYYGGETVIGEVSNEFVKKAISLDEGELVDTVLSFDDWGGDDNNWRACSMFKSGGDGHANVIPYEDCSSNISKMEFWKKSNILVKQIQP